MVRNRIAPLAVLASLLGGCAGGLDETSPVAAPLGAGGAFRVERIEVRSSFYNPRDASHAFGAAVCRDIFGR